MSARVRLVLTLSLLLGTPGIGFTADDAAGTRSTSSSGAAADTTFLGPEWIHPQDPLRRDLRVLAIEGGIPLRAMTIPATLRGRVVGDWLAGGRGERGRARGGGDDSAELRGPSAFAFERVEREMAEELSLEGGSAPPFAPVLPWIDRRLGESRLRLRPYARFEGRWNGGADATWGDHPRVGVSGSLQLSSHLSLNQDLFAGRIEDGREFGDALVNHTDLLLFVDAVDLTYARETAFVRAGRFRHGWGPGRFGNLLIAGTAPPFDQLEYGLELGSLRFRSLSGILDRAVEKNVAMHRLEWEPHPRVLLGASEGAIFPGSPFQPLYLLGLVPYPILDRIHAQDHFRDGDPTVVRNNVLVQVDATFRVRGGTVAWGEMLVDDVGTESSDHPTRLGFLGGVESVFAGGGALWDVGVESARVYNYVYSVFYDDGDWSHQDGPLGYGLGPDSESFCGFVTCRPRLTWELQAEAWLERRGEGRLGVPWYPEDDPRSEGNATTSPSELSGRVERTLGGALGVVWDPTAAFRLEVQVAVEETENPGNEPGRTEDETRLDLALHWHR